MGSAIGRAPAAAHGGIAVDDLEATPPFGSLLRSVRLAAGLTQEALAERTGVAPRTIQDLERGIGRPRRETVRRLLAVLNPTSGMRAEFERATSAPRRRADRGPGGAPPNGAGRADGPADGQATSLGFRAPVPAPLTRFVGRERELADVARLLAMARLLTLTGPGGGGKTRLALELVPRVAERFLDGVFFVSLAPLADPGLVASTVAEVLGIRETPEQPVTESLRRGIGERRMLLVLDNFEHVMAAAPLLVELLVACPRLAALVTSREMLRLRGEQVYPVPSLTLPDLRDPTAAADDRGAAVAESEAVRLFVDRAASVRPDFRLDAENADAVAELCARLDGLPLALELAAARVTMLPPRAMLARLERRLPLLAGGPRDLPARQQTLRNAITWSYDLLDADEQRLFRRLAPFAGGCTLDAIGEVCTSEGVPGSIESREAHLLDGVASLVDKSLVREVDGPDGEPRFVMLETVREYAAEQLEASGEVEAVRRRHAEHVLRLAELARSRLRGPEALSWLERLDAEHDNLRAAIDWGEARADRPGEAVGSDGLVSGIDLATRIAQALTWYWTFRGQLRQARERVGRLLARAPECTPARARALTVAQTIAVYMVDIAEARRLGEESLALWENLANRRQVAVTLARMSYAEGLLGDPERACDLLERSQALCDDPRHATDLEHPIVLIRAIAARSAGDVEGAKRLLEQSLALGRADGDMHTTLAALRHLGTLAHQRGETEAARRLFNESLELARALGDYSCIGNGLASLTLIAIDTGQGERAARLLAILDRLHEQRGFPLVTTTGTESKVAAMRAGLGEEAFAAAWATGRAMTLEQAIAYALDEPGTPLPSCR